MCIFLHIFLYLCVCVVYVGREGAGSKCFAGSVSPGAWKVIICSGEFKCGTGFDGCQAVATAEHTSHIRNFRCIKRCLVQACHGAAGEHTSHIRHILRIQRRQIQASQSGAAVEHRAHIRHILCI